MSRNLRRKVDSLDLTPMVSKLRGPKYLWTEERIDAAVQGYRAFLSSAQDEPENQDVDEVWHLHILDTQKYAKDCVDLFGGFLHHVPSYGTDPRSSDMTCSSDLQAVTCYAAAATCRAAMGTCYAAMAVCSDLPVGLKKTCQRVLEAVGSLFK